MTRAQTLRVIAPFAQLRQLWLVCVIKQVQAQSQSTHSSGCVPALHPLKEGMTSSRSLTRTVLLGWVRPLTQASAACH